jgi:diaminopimelate epimerase
MRKAHGTGNDFLVVTDPEGRLDLRPGAVAALCDRHRGIGADGIIRVVRTDAAGEDVPDSDGCTWFMDYRNADGSLAQMCGNGARVFVAELWHRGLARAGEPVRFATRGGARTGSADPHCQQDIAIAMGPAVLGEPAALTVRAGGRTWPGTSVHVPNPHAVVLVPDLAAAGPLADPPGVEPAAAFPAGANVEFVVEAGPDRIAMRVHERGVGETMSCGTGACAAAAVHVRRTGGTGAGRTVAVDVPGGRLRVGFAPGAPDVVLSGPVEVVAEVRPTGRLAALLAPGPAPNEAAPPRARQEAR